MEIIVYDKLDGLEEKERVLLILEGLATLENFSTNYITPLDAHFPKTFQKETLPITVVDGDIVKVGGYLTDAEFSEITGIHFTIEEDCCQSHHDGGCCCGHHHE